MRSLAVVDGDPIFKKIVEIMLNKLHFSGKINFYDDALAFLNASTVCDGQQLWLPDIILLDLHLPELDLQMFIEEITLREHAQKKACSVYVTSASVTGTYSIKTKKHSLLKGFIGKPISKGKLSDLVTSMIVSTIPE